MVLVQFPVVSSTMSYFRADKYRIVRLLCIIALLLGFVYFDYTQNGQESEEVSDWLYRRDPLLKMFSRLNEDLRESEESVVYVATVVLFAQYLLYISLIAKFIGKGNLILFEVLVGWSMGIFIKYVMPMPRSPFAIDYAKNLPYPLHKYIDDVSFSTSTFLALVCRRHLLESKKDVLGKLLLSGVVWLVVVFLCITYSTSLYSLSLAYGVSSIADDLRMWLAVRTGRKTPVSFKVIFRTMKEEATARLSEMKINANSAWRQISVKRSTQSSGGNASSAFQRDRDRELEELDLEHVSESGSVIFDPNAEEKEHGEEEEEEEVHESDHYIREHEISESPRTDGLHTETDESEQLNVTGVGVKPSDVDDT